MAADVEGKFLVCRCPGNAADIDGVLFQNGDLHAFLVEQITCRQARGPAPMQTTEKFEGILSPCKTEINAAVRAR
jgi:hypothetical protein